MIEWTIVGETNNSLVASGAAVLPDSTVGIPAVPPASWYEYAPAHEDAYPVQFDADGRVHGYVSKWGIVHIGFLNKDVYTPRSKTDYAKFRTGSVLLDSGETVATGRLTVNTVHPKMRGRACNEVQAFYDDSGCAIADVTVFEDEIGIYVAGSVRPTATPDQLRLARGSDWSPDWRAFKGNLEMVALLAVNLSGFIVDGLVASGGFDEDITADDIVVPTSGSYCEVNEEGELTCVIGQPFKSEPEAPSSIEERLVALEEFMRAEQFKESLASLLD